MKEVEITYENLFKLIAEEEGISYEIGEEYFQSTPIEIPDENNNWIPVKGLIKKEAEAVNIDLGTHKLMCAAKHLISNDVTMVMADELKVDGMIIGYNDVVHFINNIIKLDGKHTVYDMEVDSDTHLYQCALGIIHHNTLLTSAIIEYANKLNMRTITIVPSSSLLKQTHDYIKRFEIPVGMFGAGKKDDAPNIVATWQTLQNNKTFIRDFECVIWDEVHGAKAFIAQQIMNQEIGRAHV